MGTISRHANAPFVDGETLSGTDLEADFAAAFSAINGNIEDANVKAGAAIDASKLLDASIATGKFANTAVTFAKIAANAATKDEFTNTEGNIGLTESAQDLTTDAITTEATAGNILILSNFSAVCTAAGQITLTIKRDSTVLLTRTYAGVSESTISNVWVDTGASDSTSHTYAVTALVASGTCIVSQRSQFLLELRR